jgi:hypothetical protein
MTDKLEKTDKKLKRSQAEIDRDFKIMQAVNKTNPSEAEKKAYRELIKEQPEWMASTTGLIDTTRDYILNQNCSFLMAEVLKARLTEMRDNLGWQTSSEVEKLLIEQICINWLRVNLLEKTHAQKTMESHTTESGLYWDKRLNSAQSRYLRACESLAKVRKLLAEANLREQQARNKRAQSAALANKILQDSTKT